MSFCPFSRPEFMCCLHCCDRKSDEGIGDTSSKLGWGTSVFCLIPVHVSCYSLMSEFYYGSLFNVMKFVFSLCGKSATQLSPLVTTSLFIGGEFFEFWVMVN